MLFLSYHKASQKRGVFSPTSISNTSSRARTGGWNFICLLQFALRQWVFLFPQGILWTTGPKLSLPPLRLSVHEAAHMDGQLTEGSCNQSCGVPLDVERFLLNVVWQLKFQPHAVSATQFCVEFREGAEPFPFRAAYSDAQRLQMSLKRLFLQFLISHF